MQPAPGPEHKPTEPTIPPTNPQPPVEEKLPDGIVNQEGTTKGIHYRVLSDKTLEITEVDYEKSQGGGIVQIDNLTIKDTYPINFEGKDYEVPVSRIGDRACATVPGIDKIKIAAFKLPSTLKEIGNNAFSGNIAISGSLTIPEGVTTIGNNAFAGCTALGGTMVLPSSLTSIGKSAFSGCTALIGLDLSKATKLTTIPDGCFSGCLALGSVGNRNLTIPARITSIGGKAFWGCKGYQHLIFENGSTLTNIADNAFAGCSNFEGDLVIPNSVTRIGKSAFQGSYKLPWSSRGDPTTDKALRVYFEGLDIDQRPTTIEGFKEQVAKFLNLSKDNFPAGKNNYEPANGSAYVASDVIVEAKDWHEKQDKDDPNIIDIKVDAITVNTAGKQIKYYSGPTALDYQAFKASNASSTPAVLFNAKARTTITLSSNLTVIDADAFKNCNNVVAFNNWPTSKLTTIGAQAFQDCSNWAAAITIPNSVTTIGNEAFDGCDSLTQITISKDFKSEGVGKPEWLPDKSKWSDTKSGDVVIWAPKN